MGNILRHSSPLHNSFIQTCLQRESWSLCKKEKMQFFLIFIGHTPWLWQSAGFVALSLICSSRASVCVFGNVCVSCMRSQVSSLILFCMNAFDLTSHDAGRVAMIHCLGGWSVASFGALTVELYVLLAQLPDSAWLLWSLAQLSVDGPSTQLLYHTLE